MRESNEIVLYIPSDASESEPLVVKSKLLPSPVFACIIFSLSFAVSTFYNIYLTSDMPNLFRWFLFLFHVILTHLFTPGVVTALIVFMEKKYIGKSIKVLYFMYDLETSLVYPFWSSSVLVYWILFMSPEYSFIYNCITALLYLLWVVTWIWIISKKLVVKHFACRFRPKDFFDKLQELICQENLYQTILSATNTVPTRQYTLSDALCRPSDEQERQKADHFLLVVNKFTNSEDRDIQAADLQKFMTKLDMENFLKLLKSEESRTINRTSLRDWMGKVCEERKDLVDLLNPMSMNILAMKDLNCTALVNLVPFFLGLLPPIYLPTSKSIQEGMRFVFYERLFDIGDCFVIEDDKMIVEDIGLFRTSFRKVNDDTLVIHSNSSLNKLTRIPLTNSSRVATFEICVSTSTGSQNNIQEDLESMINKWLEKKPEIWGSGHSLYVNEAGEKNIKYVLEVSHATKFENNKVNNRQRSELLLEVKGILDKLGCSNHDVQFSV